MEGLQFNRWHGKLCKEVQLNEAIQAVNGMHEQGLSVSKNTLYLLVQACIQNKDLGAGRQVHKSIARIGFGADAYLGSHLIRMFSLCGSLSEASRVFRNLSKPNVFTWSEIILAHTKFGYGHQAITLYYQMQDLSTRPDAYVFVAVLKACASVANPGNGKLIHMDVVKSGFESSDFVGNTLVGMYAKCGSLDDAHNLFDKMLKRDVVSWTAMIAGYALHGHGQVAVHFYKGMQLEGKEANNVTFVCILKACSTTAALDEGKLIHAHIVECNFDLDVCIGNTLIDMYAKCGNLDDAYSVFQKLPNRTVVSWNAIIAGYALHSEMDKVLQCFSQLEGEGLMPDDLTFVSLLSACGHMGQVDEGCVFFDAMKEHYNITPNEEHYNCMVDLLGRAGQLNEADDLLQTMPFCAGIEGWMSLLSNCKTYGNRKAGMQCFTELISRNSRDTAGYVLMSYIYDDADMWDNATKIRDLKTWAEAWKKPGIAYIETENKVCDFIVGETNHPQYADFYAKLKRIYVEVSVEDHSSY